ncbi:MAG: hypothetical protein K2K34_01310 [Oscillospiraceae bacterium]|nr:hypothetical protein [Oscillospiraceae bacterium]
MENIMLLYHTDWSKSPYLVLAVGIYGIMVGFSKKNRAYRSDMGTPLPKNEIRSLRILYIFLGVIGLLGFIKCVTERLNGYV